MKRKKRPQIFDVYDHINKRGTEEFEFIDVRLQIQNLREQGLSIRDIAEKLGISKSAVGRLSQEWNV